jgi:hypothetical protein
VSFQLSATAAKHTEIRKALERQRDTQVKELPGGFADDAYGQEQRRQTTQTRDELEGDLVDAAITAAEAATRKLKSAGQFQVTITGAEDPGDPGSADAAAPASQHLTVSVLAFP